MMMPGVISASSPMKMGVPRKLMMAWPATDAAAAAQSKVRKFQIAIPVEVVAEDSTAAVPKPISEALISVCPSAISPPNGSVQICVARQQEVGDRVQDAVRQVEAVEQTCQERLALSLLLRVGKGFGRTGRRDGTVGRLHDRLQRRHELLQRRLERREVVGERGAEAVIGRRGRDRRCVQQGQGGCVGFGDFEVVGAGGSPAESGLLHLAVQQVDVAIPGLGGLALQGRVDCALDAGGGGGQFLGVGVDGIVEDALQRRE